MSIFRDIFSAQGNISAMRIMAFIALMVAAFVAIYALIMGRDLTAASVLCGAFLAAAFGGKALQSFSENNKGSQE